MANGNGAAGVSQGGLASLKELFASFFDFLNTGRIFSQFLPGLIVAISLALLAFRLPDMAKPNNDIVNYLEYKSQLYQRYLQAENNVTERLSSVSDSNAAMLWNQMLTSIANNRKDLEKELYSIDPLAATPKPKTPFAKDALKLIEYWGFLIILAILCGIIISQVGYLLIRNFYYENEPVEIRGLRKFFWGLKTGIGLNLYFKVKAKYGRLPDTENGKIVKFIYYMPYLKSLEAKSQLGSGLTDYYDYLIREYFRFVEFNVNSFLALLVSAPSLYLYLKFNQVGISWGAVFIFIGLLILLAAGAKNSFQEWSDAQVCLLKGSFKVKELQEKNRLTNRGGSLDE
jgi:hypothetical protein